MIAIVCLEERMGMQFGGRRVSRDRVVTEKICEICGKKTLWMHPDSAVLFAKEEKSREVNIKTSPEFLTLAEKEDYCFVEKSGLDAVEENLDKLIVFWWNRRYPSDQKLDLDLARWTRVSCEEFPGYSHEKITKEVYVK